MTQPMPTVDVGASVRDAIAAIDSGRCGVVLLVSEGRLCGLITDGDVRRAVLAGVPLDAAASSIATANPVVVRPGASRAATLDVMRARRLSEVPVVGQDGRLLGLHTLSGLVGVPDRANQAVIMAGGRGSRLGELTDHTPKPLLPVAGRPIIEWLILGLVGAGVRSVHVSVGYLADRLVDRLGDGAALGARVRYLHEDEPLGTAGSLQRLEAGDVTAPLLVMNGDLMVQFDAGALLDSHAASGAALTVATRPYTHRIPFGVVETRDGAVVGISEKPLVEVEAGAGIYVVDPALLALVPHGVASTMPDLVTRAVAAGHAVRTWAVGSEWIDVGTPADLGRARGTL